jgi:hypothetical protein
MSFFKLLAELMKTNPPYAADAAILPRHDRPSTLRSRPQGTSSVAISFFNREHQKSGTTACGMGMAGMPAKKEFGFSAQIASVSGPSAGVANCARRSTGTLATAASNNR